LAAIDFASSGSEEPGRFPDIALIKTRETVRQNVLRQPGRSRGRWWAHGMGWTWIAASMSRPMRRPDTNQFVEVRAERLEGAPLGERRRWSDEFKDRAVAAAMAADVNISALARSLEITPSQLFAWRRAAEKRASNALARLDDRAPAPRRGSSLRPSHPCHAARSRSMWRRCVSCFKCFADRSPPRRPRRRFRPDLPFLKHLKHETPTIRVRRTSRSHRQRQ